MTRSCVSKNNDNTPTNKPTLPSNTPPVTSTLTQETGGGTPALKQTTTDPTEEVEYIIWNGSLPAPKGPMTNRFSKTSVTQQKKDATELLEFLKKEDPDLAKLNVETRDIAALVNIPESELVRVVYGFGHGTSGIGSTSPIDGKILVCQGRESTLLGC